MDYAMQTAWDFKGTSAKKHEEVIEAHRKKLREHPGQAQKQLEEYSRWYQEERVPTWQERIFNRMRRKKKDAVMDDKDKSGTREAAGKNLGYVRGAIVDNAQSTRRLSGQTLR